MGQQQMILVDGQGNGVTDPNEQQVILVDEQAQQVMYGEKQQQVIYLDENGQQVADPGQQVIFVDEEGLQVLYGAPPGVEVPTSPGVYSVSAEQFAILAQAWAQEAALTA